MPSFTRREFVRKTALAAAVTQLAANLRAAATPAAAPAGPPLAPHGLRWLEGTPALLPGACWGMPWPRGRHAAATQFSLRTADGAAVPVQTRPLATWPDGTLKWTAHAIPADAPRAESYHIEP